MPLPVLNQKKEYLMKSLTIGMAVVASCGCSINYRYFSVAVAVRLQLQYTSAVLG